MADLATMSAADRGVHAGQKHGSCSMVLLKQHATGRHLVLYKRTNPNGRDVFTCQRQAFLNKKSWVACGLTQAFSKTFEEPKDGFNQGVKFTDRAGPTRSSVTHHRNHCGTPSCVTLSSESNKFLITTQPALDRCYWHKLFAIGSHVQSLPPRSRSLCS